MYRILNGTIIIVVALVVVDSTSAATRTWTNAAADNNWCDDLNWNGGAPAAADTTIESLIMAAVNGNTISLHLKTTYCNARSFAIIGHANFTVNRLGRLPEIKWEAGKRPCQSVQGR